MGRKPRLKLALEGDLAEALRIEAKRRELTPQELVENILRTTDSALTVAARRAALQSETAAGGSATHAEGKRTFRSVLERSYGPRPARRKRATARRA